MTKKNTMILIGVLAIAQTLLVLVPQVILGGAIDWPNSLDFPPNEVLPLILAELDQVRLGYGVYLVYSLAWAPIGAAIAWVALGSNTQVGPVFSLAIAFIVASAMARAIGIIRWLTASTSLAQAHSTATPEAATAIEMVQEAVNSWGGAVGELLGVSMFTVFWLIAVSILIVRNDGLPKWLGWAGFGVALVLGHPVIELFGMTANLFLATLSVTLWLFTVGGWIIWSALRSSKVSERRV